MLEVIFDFILLVVAVIALIFVKQYLSLTIRWYRIPKTLIELVLPPHRICPPVLKHLRLAQWRASAENYFQPQNGRTVFDWLEAWGLPPIPRDRYCYEKGKWVDQMSYYEKKEYLEELREGRARPRGRVIGTLRSAPDRER
jgi:hypothetical protein